MTKETAKLGDVRRTFAAHKAGIIGAARRAARGTSIWALVTDQGEWQGIVGPFGRGSYPAILHNSNNLYSLRFSADPFMSRDTFNDALTEEFEQWSAAEREAEKMAEYERDMTRQYEQEAGWTNS